MFLFVSTLLFATPLESPPPIEENTWMGTVSLSIYPDGGSFQLQGYVSEETWIPLPGESGTWPYLVQEKENNLLIIEQHGIPHTLLKEGHHNISGMFSWIDIPTQIRIPPAIGMVHINQEEDPIPLIRRDDRVWISTDPNITKSKKYVFIQRIFEHQKTNIHLFIQSTDHLHIMEYPIPLLEGDTLVDIQSTSSYWYKENKLLINISEGEHSFLLTTHNTTPPPPLNEKPEEETWDLSLHTTKTKNKISLRREFSHENNMLKITDHWSGVRNKEYILGGATDQPTLLSRGDKPHSHIYTQHLDEEILSPIEERAIQNTQATLTHKGNLRACTSWPILSTMLWTLFTLIIWKIDLLSHRKTLLFSSLLCVIISPLILLSLIGIIGLYSWFHVILSAEHKKIFSLCAMSVFSGLILSSISPTVQYIIPLSSITPSIYWVETNTLITISILVISSASFALWKNASIALLLCLFLVPFSQNAHAESGFPLCSISLEQDNISISGQVHLDQEGEWILPGPIESLQPNTILVDGIPFHAFRKTEDNFLALFLPAGISEFVLKGTYNAPFGIHFPHQASRLDFSSSTHQIEGLEEDNSHKKTLFFWTEEAPHIFVPKADLKIDISISTTQTIFQYRIEAHTGSKTYLLPTWYDQSIELPTQQSKKLFPATTIVEWSESIPTPTSLHFSLSEQKQYNIQVKVNCANEVLCTHEDQPIDSTLPIPTLQPIDITQISLPDTRKVLTLLSEHQHTVSSINDSKHYMHTPALWLSQRIPQKEWHYAHDHDPQTTFIPIGSSHIIHLSFSLIICAVFSLLLAKQKNSPLNLSEWLWISIGSYVLHPLLLPLSIIVILFIQRWFAFIIYIGLMIFFTFSLPIGANSWSNDTPVLCLSTENITYGLCIWILGIFFFLQSFQLSKKTVKIG